MNSYGQELFNSYHRMISVINGYTHEYYGVHNPAVKSKGEQCKCKSCTHCTKINKNYYCSTHAHNYISPMQTACKQYERKKKKKK